MYEFGTQLYSKNLKLTSRLLIRMAHEPLEMISKPPNTEEVKVDSMVYSRVKFIDAKQLTQILNKKGK